MNNFRKYPWLLAAVLALGACSSDDNGGMVEEPLTPGSADFTKFVSLGNSLTAGYTDGALFQASQNFAFTKLMADKFTAVGGGEFRIPFMNDNVGGLTLGGMVLQGPRLILDGTMPAPLPNATPSTDLTQVLPGPFNNMGVPGAKSFHLLAPNYGNLAGLLNGTANPYFVRFASSPSASMLEDTMAQNPTFFTLWIGNNDVLGYAVSGGDGSNPITPIAGQPGEGFEATYNLLVQQMVSNGAKGVLANIPNVATIPHFTTIPFNPLDPIGNPEFAAQIPQLNELFGQLNQVFDLLGVPDRKVVYTETEANPLLIHDETLADISQMLIQVLTMGGLDEPTANLLGNQFGQSRQANANDLVVLAAGGAIGQIDQQRVQGLVAQGVPAETAAQLSVSGVTLPMEDKWILLPSEQAEISNATTAYNNIIATAAQTHNLALVDMNALMNQVAAGGINVNGITFKADLVFGQTFGLDGIHLTARANAFVANKFLEAINAQYGSNFRPYNVGDYPAMYPVNLP